MSMKFMLAAALLGLSAATVPGASAQDRDHPMLISPTGSDCGRGLHMTTLHFVIGTGDDDLRGGSDNVQLYVRLAGRSDWILVPLHGGLNRGAHWANGSVHPVDVTIGGGPCPPPPAYITGLRLQTTFGGGMGGDNWNLQSVHVDWIGTDAAGAAVSGPMADAPAFARGGYRHRFTGDNIPYDIPMLPTRADPSEIAIRQ